MYNLFKVKPKFYKTKYRFTTFCPPTKQSFVDWKMKRKSVKNLDVIGPKHCIFEVY